MKRLIIFLSCLALVPCAVFLYLRTEAPAAPAKAAADAALEAVASLSREQYEAEKNRLISIMTVQDARAAIQALKEDMDEDPSVTASCHELLHELGRATYGKYKDFGKAMRYQDEVCVSGFIHGILEAYFKQTKDLSHALQTVCGSFSAHTYSRWQCQHGVGHGLMFESGNDLPGSLRHCGEYADASDESACANGAYMENFNADQLDHFSKYVDPMRPLYPCDEAKKDRGDCYMNAPIQYLRLHPNDYKGASKICDGAPAAERGNCYFGIGAQATRRNIDRPEFVEAVCGSSEDWRALCLHGSVSGYIGHYVSATRVLGICDTFKAQNREACRAAVQSMKRDYPDL